MVIKEWNEKWSKRLKRQVLVQEINSLCYELSGMKGRIPARSSVRKIKQRYLNLLGYESTNDLTLEGLDGLLSLINAKVNSIYKFESLLKK